MESSQGYVAWTDAAYAEDASYRSMTKMGYLRSASSESRCWRWRICRLRAIQIVRAGSVGNGVIFRR